MRRASGRDACACASASVHTCIRVGVRAGQCVCVCARARHTTHTRAKHDTRARDNTRATTHVRCRARQRACARVCCVTLCVRVGLCVLCEPAGGLALSLRPGDGAACAQYGVYYGQRLTRRSALFSNAGRTRFCAYFFSFSTPQSCRITKLQSGLRG